MKSSPFSPPYFLAFWQAVNLCFSIRSLPFFYAEKKPSEVYSATDRKHYENQKVQMNEQSLTHTK